MAVSAGIFIQVFLVVFFRGEEIPEGFQFNSQLRAGFFFFCLPDGPNLRKKGFICVVDAGAVLDPFIMSLTVN